MDYFAKLDEVIENEVLVRGFVPPEPGDDDLKLVHSEDYIEMVKGMSKTGIGWLSGDTPAFKGMHEASLKMIHSTLSAGRYVLEEKTNLAIAIGGGLHHAGKNYGEGFCVYNDIAILAKWFLKKAKKGIKRIFIFDYDAHQGNGTMEVFYKDPNVFFLSVHQDPRTLYPGQGFVWQIGEQEGKGFTCNVPLPPGAGKTCYELVIREVFRPLMEEYRPDVLIANGGSDPHHADPLTDLGLTLEGFHMIGESIRNVGLRISGKIVDAIASGYDERIIPRAWTSIICGLCGFQRKFTDEDGYVERKKVIEHTKKVISDVKRILRDYWSF